MNTAFKQKIIARFGQAVASYDDHAAVQKQAAKRLATFLPALPVPESPHILEIGCGTGFFTEHLIAAYPKAELFITDISEPMLQACKNRYAGPNRHFSLMDGEAPDITGPFDLIASSMTFQWFEDFEGSIERLKRLLSPQARILFSTLGAQSYIEWKSALKDLGLPDAVLQGQRIPEPLAEDLFQTHYDRPVDFLINLKQIGATASRQEARLSPSQLRAALHKCGNKMTYHVVYAADYNRP